MWSDPSASNIAIDPEHRTATRLVAVSGWGGQADRQKAFEAGFDAHLTKPVDIAAVRGALADARDRDTPTPAGAI